MAEKKEVKRGVGTAAVEAIKAGHTNQEVLEIVLKEFPDANTGISSINWYRNRLRSEGAKGVKTNRELTKAKKKADDPLD